MKRHHRTRLTVERLEDRWVPATVRFSAGVLNIQSSFGETVAITQTAANTFTVTGAPGSFMNVNHIFFTGTGGGETVNVNLGTFTYQGVLTINTAAGHDLVDVSNGEAQGNVSIVTGVGNDSINLAEIGGALAIRGSLTAVDTQGNNAMRLINAGDLEVGTAVSPRDFSVTGFRSIVNASTTRSITIWGNMTIQNGFVSLGNQIDFNDALRLFVGKNLNITTGIGNDSILLGTNVAGRSVFVQGRMSLATGSGADSITINGAGGGTLALTVDTGAGNDEVELVNTDIATWIASIRLGDGDDTFTLTNGAGPGAELLGTVNGGAGTNTAELSAATDWTFSSVTFSNFLFV